MVKDVLIIGCGYAGLVSAWRFSRHRKDFKVTVIDPRLDFNFLPLLPDCIGRNIPLHSLSYPVSKLSLIYGFDFLNSRVLSVDLAHKKVITEQGESIYDYLIIASGSQTNFYGDLSAAQYAYKLDDIKDAGKLLGLFDDQSICTYLIAGGGYTGIELATNLRMRLIKSKALPRIIIVERAPGILNALPEWMQKYVCRNLEMMNIELRLNTVISKIEATRVSLSNHEVFDQCRLIWAAGVRSADFVQTLPVEKNPQGRVKVDEFLRIDESCFVIGDAAYFQHNNGYLRMAVQFAIAQGSAAAINIMNMDQGKKLAPYRPVDMGYIIPMANNHSCGNVFNMDIQGRLGIGLHYLMSVYRAYGLKNKLNIIAALTKGGK